MTKQRMKFLMEQREKVGGGGGAGGGGVGSEDLSNPQWRATIDAWIPTWRRWEEAEAKRIKKRDSRKSRKRKGRESDDEDADDAGAGGGEGGGTVDWKDSSSPAITGTGNGNGFTQSSMPPPPPVRLPPGFDSMFNHAPHTPTARMGYPSQYQPSSSGTVDAGVMNAMLDTLNKLNKRLDSTPPNPRASPVISALVSNADSLTQSQESASRQMEGRSGSEIAPLGSSELIGTLKEELRLEMRAELRRELEKDRAALEEKLDSVQRTQDMILEMLRQEPD